MSNQPPTRRTAKRLPNVTSDVEAFKNELKKVPPHKLPVIRAVMKMIKARHRGCK